MWQPGAHRIVDPTYKMPDLFKIIVFAGLYLDGIEFHFWNFDIVRVGKTTGTPAAQIDLRHGDYLRRIFIRSGAWVDGLSIVLSGGRELPWCGGTGGQAHEIEPEFGKRIVGLYGFAGEGGVDGLGVVFADVKIQELVL